MAKKFRVAFLGFSDFERSTLASYFRLAVNRSPRYDQVQMLNDADFLVADADHAASVQLVVAIERLAHTVFIGSQAPAGAMAWVMRPIDPLHVMREIDAMVAQAAADAAPPAAIPGLDPQAMFIPETDPPAAQAQVPGATPDAAGRSAAPAMAPTPQSQPAPAAVAAASPLPAPPQATAPASPARAQPPPRWALLVDDSEIALRFLQTRLQRFGLLIDRASSSAKAIEQLALRNYDFVFLDVELGPASELDGLALCQRIKRSPIAVNAVVTMVSAHDSELDRVRGTLAGCDAYLGKPLVHVDLERLMLRHGLKAAPELAGLQGAPPA